MARATARLRATVWGELLVLGLAGAEGVLGDRRAGPIGLGQGDRGRDVGQVRQPLGEVAQQLPAVAVVLLGGQAEVAAAGRHPAEQLPGLLHAALVGQALGQPERAGDERALLADQVVVVSVAIFFTTSLLRADRLRAFIYRHTIIAP